MRARVFRKAPALKVKNSKWANKQMGKGVRKNLSYF
jgi:hypothetical protein